MMKEKRKIIILVLAVIILMLITVFLVGRSFGFFKYTKEGEKINIITINGIETEIISEDQEVLNLANAYPITDSEGLSLEPFVFSMTNTSSRSLSYTIKVEIDSDKMADCVLEGQILCPELSTDYIKYVYKKNDGTYTEPRLLGANNNIITNDVISGKETVTSSIILWIDSEAGNEIMNHYFYGKIIITGEEYVTKNLKDTILSSNTLIETEPDLTTSSNNTDDASGLYKSTATNDGSATYYFRGNVENNYVSFAGFMWRIVRINEDGTVRLIMQDGIENNTTYTFNPMYNEVKYMYYSESREETRGAKYYLDNWYQTNIVEKGYSDNIVTGNYYCEQAKIAINTNHEINSGADMIVYDNYKEPNFECANDANNKGLLNDNIGLISYDEVIHAGGYPGNENNNYYLHNSSYWWTMSPSGFFESYARLWTVYIGSRISYGATLNSLSLRPVINLKTDTIVTGEGTSVLPYIVQ